MATSSKSNHRGETASVTFATAALKKRGDYTFLCTFPGHNALMRGTFKFG